MSPQDFEKLKNDFRQLSYDRSYVFREKSGKFFFKSLLYTCTVEFDLNYELTTSYIRIVPYATVNIENYNFFDKKYNFEFRINGS